MLDVLKKKKEEKDWYVWNTVFKGWHIMTKLREMGRQVTRDPENCGEEI